MIAQARQTDSPPSSGSESMNGRRINLLKAVPKVAIIRLLAPLLLLACVSLAPVRAQDSRCQAAVESAFSSISRNCAELERDSLCYSHPQVEARFADDSNSEDLSSLSQRVSVSAISSVRSGGLDVEQGRWGLAIFHLGAKYPRTYKGPGILILLGGAAEIINDTDPATVARIVDPLSTAALVETTLFKNPGIIPEPVRSAVVDELLLVDAFDDSGDWLRVVNDGAVAWAQRKDLARLQAMESLPTIGIGAAFPFHALSISTSAEYPACDQAEPMVAIQTPADRPVNLTVNGVDIHIGSLVTFQQVHRNALSLTVHRGKATTVFGQIVQQGESVIGILGRRAERDLQALDWSGALPASAAEIARGQRAQEALNLLAAANGWPAQKTFEHPPDLVHIVKRGETLYSIARRYETSVADIILANLGDEPIRLYSGTKLIIPNPGSGFAGQGSVPLGATREE